MQLLNDMPVTFITPFMSPLLHLSCHLYIGSPFINYIIQHGFDERHAYIGGMFGAGKHGGHLERTEGKGLQCCLLFQGSTLQRIRPRVTSMSMGLEGAMAVRSTRTGPATLASG